MTPHRDAQARLARKVGAACAIIGAILFGGFRLLHGDTPAAAAAAAIDFVGHRPI